MSRVFQGKEKTEGSGMSSVGGFGGLVDKGRGGMSSVVELGIRGVGRL